MGLIETNPTLKCVTYLYWNHLARSGWHCRHRTHPVGLLSEALLSYMVHAEISWVYLKLWLTQLYCTRS